MGLVDYSESDSSGSEPEAKAPAKATTKAALKKPLFRKVIDRSNPGKVVVNLPQSIPFGNTNAPLSDEPPAKRARTGGSGGIFVGFNSFLPPPKNAGKPALKDSAPSQTHPGVNLKTSSEPGFTRNAEPPKDSGAHAAPVAMSLPTPKRPANPLISDELKPAEEVKLFGKPLMFKPLSVARNATKNKISKTGATKTPAASMANTQSPATETDATAKGDYTPAPSFKKSSLFSLHVEESSVHSVSSKESDAYAPLFETGESADQYSADAFGDCSQYAKYAETCPVLTPTIGGGTESLNSIANELNLSAAARRDLFGRGGSIQTAKQVINFNMDQEYNHNEEIRAAGEQQIHNPVRAIQGGKHSLRQLVQNVANQRDALEDSFAKGKTNRKEASSRYGW